MYKVLTADSIEALENIVNLHSLHQGFKIVGGVCVTPGVAGAVRYMQAVLTELRDA